MQFTYPIEVEPNTLETDPERLEIKLCIGVIQKISIYFPWGCAGLAGIRVFHYEHQLYPTNPDEWFAGNEVFIEFDDEYSILEGPNEFKVEAYNLDELYSHSPVVSFNVLRGTLGGMSSQGWIGA